MNSSRRTSVTINMFGRLPLISDVTVLVTHGQRRAETRLSASSAEEMFFKGVLNSDAWMYGGATWETREA